MSLTQKNRIRFYPQDQSGYIPAYSNASTKELLQGLSIKTDRSMSKIIEEQLRPLFDSMSEDEKKILREYARRNKKQIKSK